jgi:hypothetical protein
MAGGIGSRGGGRLEAPGAGAVWSAKSDDWAMGGGNPGRPSNGGGGVGRRVEVGRRGDDRHWPGDGR